MLNQFKTKYGISKPIFFLGAASLLADAASEMIYPLLPLFLTKNLGANAAFVGLVEGVADSTAAVTKFLFGWWSDRLKKRTPFVVAGYTVANFFRPFIGLAGFPWHVLVLRFVDRVGKGMRTAPRDAWLAALAGTHKRGAIFGFHRAMDHTGAVIGPLLATAFLWLFPGQLRQLFLWSAVPGLIAAIFVVAAKKASLEPVYAPPSTDIRQSTTPLPVLFKRYLMILSVFTLASSSDIFLVLKLQTSGVDTKWIPLCWSGLHMVKAMGSMPGGWLSDRIGHRRSIILGWLIFSCVYLVLGMAQHTGVVVAAFLIYGFYPVLTESAEKAFISDLVHDHTRGTAFGLHNLITGLGAFPASLLFGYLWSQTGANVAFVTGAGLAAVAALGLIFLSHHFDAAMGPGRNSGRHAPDQKPL